MDVDVVIVGGGLSGLFTAAELAQRGVDDVVVVERAPFPGGVARTLRVEGFALEPAAGTLLLPNPHLDPLLERCGVATTPAAAAHRYVYTSGRLVAIPASPKAVLAPLVGWGAKLRAAAEPFVRSRPRSEDETLTELLERRFGRTLGGVLARLAAAGVFAGDPGRLSARSAFPALTALEREAGSIVRGGLRRRRRSGPAQRTTSHLPVPDMAGLADALGDGLGARLRLGYEVGNVAADAGGLVVDGPETMRARHVVLACRPKAAAGLLGGEVGDSLRQAVAAPVAVAWLGGSGDAVPLPEGYGALVAPDAAMRAVGILFESSYAPARAPEGMALAKVIAGGAFHPEVAGWDDDRILSTATAEASAALGRDLQPTFGMVVRHVEGIPQYEPGHREWLGRIEAEAPQNLHFTGWGYRGVGVAHIAGDAARVADRVAGR